MRILFVSQYFYPEPFSNTTLVRALVERGHEVEVLTAIPNYPGGEFYDGYASGAPRTDTFEGHKVHRVRTISRGNSTLKLILNYLCFALFGSVAARTKPLARPDVIFLSQLSPILMALPAIVAARRFKVPLVYWVQDIWPESATYTLGLRRRWIVRPLTWLCGWIYRRADHVMVQSAAFPPMITRFGVPPEKISVFPNTASDQYHPVAPEDAPQERALMPPRGGFRIMFAGNIGQSQDFDTLLHAAELLKPEHRIDWIIIGSGRDQARVEAEVARRGLQDAFHFLGRFPEERMKLFFAHADAMLVSLKRNDIFALTVPYKVQSYLACGKPIIASLDGEGARVISASGAGVVAAAESPAQLAEAIRKMMEQFEDRKASYRDNALAYFEGNYAFEMLIDRLEARLASEVATGSN